MSRSSRTTRRARAKKRPPIARRLLSMLRGARASAVVDLEAYRRGMSTAEELRRTVVADEDLAELEPAHAMYVYVQNQISVLAEQLSYLEPVSKIADRIGAAQDEYAPSGPPMSPLTVSYFTCWAFFDAAVGRARETMGTCVVAMGEELGLMAPGFLEIARAMQRSRMGVYVHEGTDANGRALLREIVDDEPRPCIVPSGWRGQRGELWLARVLPPPGPAFEESVVFTTPYILGRPGPDGWRDYLQRETGSAKDPRAAYERLMKYGDWPEHIFQMYAGHRHDAIFLEGVPDLPESMPCSPINMGL